MSDKKTEESLPESDEFFGDVISYYPKKQAVADGILIDFEKFNGRGVVFTTNLIESLEKFEIPAILLKGLALEFEHPDLKIIYLNERKIYVDWNSQDLTFMLPKDY